MAKKKKTSAILEEQRRARQEFIELKKMQNGEMETGPKPSDVAIVPKTFSEKSANIWYHYKWVLIIGTLIAVMLTVCIVQCARKVDADLKIVVFTQTYIGDTDAIAKLAEQYAEDINGDGKVKVEVINCSYNAESSNLEFAGTCKQKLVCAIRAENDALLYIYDQAAYDELLGQYDEMFLEEPAALNEAFYKETTGDNNSLPEGLLIGCRNPDSQQLKDNKNLDKCFEVSQKIFKAFTE